jgi:selenide,water dikinase
MTASAEQTVRLTALSPGAGCACKLPMASLDRLIGAFGRTPQAPNADVLIGLAEGDDAAVLRLDDECALVLTTDFFTPIVDDPYDWGRIAAANALSDVYAMGGRPLIGLNLAAWPGSELPIEMLGEVLRGGTAVAADAGCTVVGGHTIDDPVPKYGMAVLGLAHPDRLFAIDRAAAGDRLVLTKPLGTGVIATAVKRGSPGADVVRAAVDSMTSLNRSASEAALAAGVRAATDVTGFGLLGHLHRMLRASGVSAEVYADRAPLLPGAAELAVAGFVSGGTRANMSYLADAVQVGSGVDSAVCVLLHDAQTSGGLLLAVPPAASGLIDDLRTLGLLAALVGRVVEGPAGRIVVRAGAADEPPPR